MNDNEIIKGLECRIDNFSKAVLDLITRQKAEVERLKDYKALYKNLREEHLEIIKAIKFTKSEARKEFAERLKAYVDVGHLRPPTEKCFSELDVANMLDNLLAEMESERI